MTLVIVILFFIAALVGCGVLLYVLNQKFFGDGWVFRWRNNRYYKDDYLWRRDRLDRLRKKRIRKGIKKYRRDRRRRRKLDRIFEKNLG